MVACNMDESTHHQDTEFDVNELVSRTREQSPGCFNKSMDFGRHTVGRISANSSASQGLYGESYATLGESFMGDSFADLENSFAVNGGCSLLGGNDAFDYSDSNNEDDLESTVRNVQRKNDLATVLDMEEEEEEEEEDLIETSSKGMKSVN